MSHSAPGRIAAPHGSRRTSFTLTGAALVGLGTTGLASGSDATLPIALLGTGLAFLLCSHGDVAGTRRSLVLVTAATLGTLVALAGVRPGLAATVAIFLVVLPLAALLDVVRARRRRPGP